MLTRRKGHLLNDASKNLAALEIADNEMLACHVRDTSTPVQAAPQAPRHQGGRQQHGQRGQPDPETLRLQVLGNPDARRELENRNPELAAAIDSPERFSQVFSELGDQERAEQARRRQEIADLNADPFDVDAQMRIAEMIREDRVE